MSFALKRLRRSDLTFFDAQLKRQSAGNQKAINLNRNVFIDLLFPLAPARSSGAPVRFPCELRIFGPGELDSPTTVMRKVIAAGGTQKNWRLNGETVSADRTASRPDRYDNLKEHDLALFRFEGADVPHAIDLLLVSSQEEQDRELFAGLNDLLGSARMRALTEAELLPMLDVSPESHPLRELFDPDLDVALSEAAQGSAAAMAVVRKRGIRRTTHVALAEARANAERIGREGESLIAAYLNGQVMTQALSAVVWEAEANATHPFDFTIVVGKSAAQVEVKSTEGDHSRSMIFSQAEMEFAAGCETLEVWRVSRLTREGGVVRRSKRLPELAREILAGIPSMNGVCPTGWTISPSALEPWSDEFTALYEDDPDD
ncbi:hypothetical protein CDO24_06015 [Sinorhizobium meliloti]|nr:hypothetical protein CDO24_06015 [Sinorhizobium meliloti]